MILEKFGNELYAPYQPFTFLVVVADVEKTIERGLVEIGEGRVVFVDALGEKAAEILVDFLPVPSRLLLRETTFFSTADDVWNKLHPFTVTDYLFNKENPVRH